MKALKFLILKNEMPNDHNGWISALKNHENITWKVIELMSDNWLTQIRQEDFDLLLLRPPGRSSFYKQLYDDRVEHLNFLYPEKIYPNLDLIKIYENKRYFRDWMLTRGIPHPKTWLFYSKKEAIDFINQFNQFPIVSKLNIGASGKGVSILKKKEMAMKEIYQLFGEGKKLIGTPNLRKGSLIKKIRKLFENPKFAKNRLKEYKQQSNEIHQNYTIFQEFIYHSFEWRCVVIGDSFFAHKKLVKNGKTSGSLLKDYGNPPLSLLNFVRDLSLTHKIDSAAIDIFEHKGSFLINEIQCFFGQSDDYQMLVNNTKGRFYYTEHEWKFEAGSFNENQCFNLRLEHIVEKILK
jgi:glutathione synthase/RimK-type ligase-like ATP-grasp enzyme